MISPIAVDSPLNLEFERLAAKLFGDLQCLLLCTDGLRIGERALVNPRLINHNVCAAKDVVRNGPGLPEALRHGGIHNKVDWDFVLDGNLGRISSVQNLRRQISCLLANLVKVSTVIEERPTIRFAGSDAKNRNARSPTDGDDRVCGDTNRDISSDP